MPLALGWCNARVRIQDLQDDVVRTRTRTRNRTRTLRADYEYEYEYEYECQHDSISPQLFGHFSHYSVKSPCTYGTNSQHQINEVFHAHRIHSLFRTGRDPFCAQS